ncbi:N-succinyldiaminopimelate aminotransferase [Allocatelliglobosispora scoriae]|uniref:N-succinyldiaminopimelate aminotransferase n=1 Tax=Allocatelliglobosispora scoriae TaxID=643052 RepID=A0A841C0N5_9ACTN|nr:N-succinyldiaminopimelate aminotransferase [Allocatelliglobosispora scoriae]
MTDVTSSKLRGLGTTIFAEMTALAKRTGAVNLGQGFPDTDGPAGVLAAARDAISAGLNQYPPVDGLPELKSAIAAARADRYGQVFDPDGGEIMVTAGATEAIASVLIALCEPGDEVVVFEPYYDSYLANMAMAGAVRRPVQLRMAGDRFGFDPAELRAAITPKTRLLLLNSPHNPTGKVFTAAELTLIAELCVEHDLIAVTDEVYEYLTFDGAEHIPLATLPGMRERTLTISSAGKTFSATGWKIGWVCGPAPLVAAARKAKQFLTFAGGTPFQAAIAVGLRDELDWVAALRADLQERRDRLRKALTAMGAETYPCEGTYFLQIDVRSLGYEDGVEFCRDLAEKAKVVAIPAQVFFDDVETGRRYVRFAFCKSDAVLDEGIRRLATFTS